MPSPKYSPCSVCVIHLLKISKLCNPFCVDCDEVKQYDDWVRSLPIPSGIDYDEVLGYVPTDILNNLMNKQ